MILGLFILRNIWATIIFYQSVLTISTPKIFWNTSHVDSRDKYSCEIKTFGFKIEEKVLLSKNRNILVLMNKLQSLGFNFGYPTACVYKFINDCDSKIIIYLLQYFLI